MEEPNTYSASDLIHLYLDGETDSLQQALLFGALAGSSDLQMEFTEALLIRGAIEQERADTVPPAHLTQSLFEKAGFGSPAPEIAAASGRFVTLLRKFGSALLIAIGSTAITMLLLMQSSRNRYDELAAELQRVRGELAGDMARQSPRNSTPSGKPAEMTTAPGNRAAGQAAQATTGIKDGAVESRATGTGANVYPKASPAAGNRVHTMSTQKPARNESAAMPAVRTAELRTTAVADREAIVATPPVPADGDPPAIADPFASAAGSDAHRFSIVLRSMTEFGQFPARDLAPGERAWYDNASLGMLYRLSEHHAVGFEGGREYLPLYRLEENGFRLQPALAWVAGSYRFEAGAIDRGGLFTPFAQAALGGTISGPLGRGAAGITFSPDDHIGLSLGIEGTMLLYRFAGNWYSTRKTGLTYQMSVNF